MNRQQRSQQTREKILQTALRLFGMYSYDQASMNQLHQQAKVSKGLIYHHFKDKDALYLSCIEASIHDFLAFLKAEVQLSGNFKTDLESYFDTRKRYFSQQNVYAKVFLQTYYQVPEHLSQAYVNIHQVLRDYNTQLLHDMLSQIEIQSGLSLEEAIDYFSLIMTSFQQNPMMNDGIVDHEKKLKQMINVICYGIMRR